MPWLNTSSRRTRPARVADLPSTPDVVGPPYFSYHQPAVTIDRFAANPGVEYIHATVPTNPYSGAAPTMFSAGDWPLFTSSSLDVGVLRWVPWKVRHAAALSTDRQFVMYCVEEGNTDLFDPDDLQTPAGANAMGAYFERVRRWASAEEPPLDPDTDVSGLFHQSQP